MKQALIPRFVRPWMILPAAAVLAIVVSMLSASSLFTYNNSGSTPCVWPYNSNTPLEPLWKNDPDYPPTGNYVSAYSQARSQWDSSNTPVVFDHDTSQTKHKFGVRDLGQSGPLGHTSWWCVAWLYKRSSTSTVLNSYHLDSESQTYKKSVATHELGHYIGVRHSNVTPAIMNTDGDNDVYYNVYEDDECAVNSRYSHSTYPVTCDD